MPESHEFQDQPSCRQGLPLAGQSAFDRINPAR
jgi:hypothetical protein